MKVACFEKRSTGLALQCDNAVWKLIIKTDIAEPEIYSFSDSTQSSSFSKPPHRNLATSSVRVVSLESASFPGCKQKKKSVGIVDIC